MVGALLDLGGKGLICDSEEIKMKKFLIGLVLAIAPLGAMALPGGPGEPVFNFFSGFAWYQGTGAGLVHERWSCDGNWENCDGNWVWYPTTKWPDGPDYCDEDAAGPLYAGFIGDVGDGSDILLPGEYYVCIKAKVFREK